MLSEERTPVALLAMPDSSYTIVNAFVIDGGSDTTAEARAKYKEYYPGRTARRMTHLGMMAGICLKKSDTDQKTPIIYASAYAESKSLETFIDSFPEASPLHFQCSIHPSAVEQALIPSKQAINSFYPVTSDFNLAGQAIETAHLAQSDSTIVVGGEERGTWLNQHKLASNDSFAFCLQLARGREGVGTIQFIPEESTLSGPPVDLIQLAKAIKSRENLKIPSFATNSWIHLNWE